MDKALVRIEMVNEVGGSLLRTVLHLYHLPTLVCNAESAERVIPSLPLGHTRCLTAEPALIVLRLFSPLAPSSTAVLIPLRSLQGPGYDLP